LVIDANGVRDPVIDSLHAGLEVVFVTGAAVGRVERGSNANVLPRIEADASRCVYGHPTCLVPGAADGAMPRPPVHPRVRRKVFVRPAQLDPHICGWGGHAATPSNSPSRSPT